MNHRMESLRRYFNFMVNDLLEYLYFFNNDLESELTTILYVGNKTNVTIPNQIDSATVTIIGGTTFSDNTSIESVVIPQSITEIL